MQIKSIKRAELQQTVSETDYHHMYDTVTIPVETTNYVFCTPNILLPPWSGVSLEPTEHLLC